MIIIIKGEEILKEISPTIKEELYTEYFGKLLFDTKLFKLNFTKECLKALSLRIKEITAAPNEVLFKKGETDSRIIFLLDGEVELFIT